MFHEAFYPRRRHKCSISGVIVLDYKFESTGDLTFILERAVGKGWEFAEWGGGRVQPEYREKSPDKQSRKPVSCMQ